VLHGELASVDVAHLGRNAAQSYYIMPLSCSGRWQRRLFPRLASFSFGCRSPVDSRDWILGLKLVDELHGAFTDSEHI
jgi:hypothetical protein